MCVVVFIIDTNLSVEQFPCMSIIDQKKLCLITCDHDDLFEVIALTYSNPRHDIDVDKYLLMIR